MWHLTSAFFANEIAALVPGPETRVLEVGTGTGVVALAAHRVARDVVAVDINPDAVRCARLNAAQNGLELGFEVLEGDMFSPLGDRRFGMILCNPPYFRGTAGNHIERAYYSGPHFEWIHRFAAKARPQLEPSGSLVCVLADTTDVDGIIAIFGENGWSAREVARRETLTEVLTLWQFRPSTSEEGDA